MGELPSRSSFLGTLGSTAHGSLFMEGDSHKPTFLFIHGFATYVDDLIPLALAFNQDGYSCDLLALEGHGGSFEDLRDTGYERWYEQVSHAYTFRKEKGGKVFIVGFSLGALLAMDYARDHSVDGIIGISTFMGPRGQTAALYRLAAAVGVTGFTRMLQVTAGSTREELNFNLKVPMRPVQDILEEARRVTRDAGRIECPLLLLHSVDDKAADYNEVAKVYVALGGDSRLVTFRELNHFLQFDIPAVRLRDLVLDFVGLKQAPPSEVSSEDSLKNVYAQVSEESRQWAGHIFNLIVGFFSLFGALVFLSFDTVVNFRPAAPYYAMLYSFSANIYLTLIILYYYYLNRSLAYIQHHIEPSMTFVTWVSYKSYKWLAGRESVVLTGAVSVLLLLVPVLISVGSIVYCVYYFPASSSLLTHGDRFLQLLIVVSVMLLAFNLVLGMMTMRSSQRELHGGMVRPRTTSMSFEGRLMELYASIRPGITKQPWQASMNRHYPSKVTIVLVNLWTLPRDALARLFAFMRSRLGAGGNRSEKA